MERSFHRLEGANVLPIIVGHLQVAAVQTIDKRRLVTAERDIGIPDEGSMQFTYWGLEALALTCVSSSLMSWPIFAYPGNRCLAIS
jgi:hypothetical protein